MLDPDAEDDEINNSVMQSMFTTQIAQNNKGKDKKICVLTKGDCLIYVALSSEKDETISFLRKQLEFLHMQLISVTTRHMMKMLS